MTLLATLESPPLRQRADYTHRHNRDADRHGWLRLTPAYSVKVVTELLERVSSSSVVLDPFCGTGTTALVASSLGHRAITTEINPFLAWYAKAKLDIYAENDRKLARALVDRAIRHVYRESHELSSVPNLHNIQRWWHAKELSFLLGVKGSFADFGRVEASRKAENLVKIMFCRTLISLSNAAFNHQSMSFKDSCEAKLPFSDRTDVYVDVFLASAKRVLEGTLEHF
jgi:hypothetical protein